MARSYRCQRQIVGDGGGVGSQIAPRQPHPLGAAGAARGRQQYRQHRVQGGRRRGEPLQLAGVIDPPAHAKLPAAGIVLARWEGRVCQHHGMPQLERGQIVQQVGGAGEKGR